jgi:BirA family biotin operon repressor/biotin-[acetyl-CoA-carboxylase] ligase
VWKRISALKKEGYIIEASTKKGYRLSQSGNPYGKLAIQGGLTSSRFGHRLEFFKAVDSTNTVLKRFAADGAPEGTVVIADSQDNGRGRLGRSWMSAPGLGIWMSVLLKPPFHPSEVQTLTLAASVAVCRALEPLKISGLGIKWPNDIMVKDKKVCGILTELSAEAERVAWVILGIGINVNHQEQDFPEEIAPIASSLRLSGETLSLVDRGDLAAGLINEIEKVYDEYIEKGSLWVVDEWKKYNLTLGKRVRLISQNQSLIATSKDITPDGKLVVELDDGSCLEVLSGEISLRDV